jgi:hypothetical protein
MKLGIPQIILIGLYMISLGIELARNGQDKTGKYNVVTTFVALVLILGLLYWGGFFS